MTTRVPVTALDFSVSLSSISTSVRLSVLIVTPNECNRSVDRAIDGVPSADPSDAASTKPAFARATVQHAAFACQLLRRLPRAAQLLEGVIHTGYVDAGAV